MVVFNALRRLLAAMHTLKKLRWMAPRALSSITARAVKHGSILGVEEVGSLDQQYAQTKASALKEDPDSLQSLSHWESFDL